jgi:Flp pilus assembly pilin Flp
MKKKRHKRKFTVVKKTLKNFMQDEDGFVSKDKILKVGLGTVTAVGMLGSLNTAHAFTSHVNLSGQLRNVDIDARFQMSIPTHQNGAIWEAVPGTNCERLVNHSQSQVGGAPVPVISTIDRVGGSVDWRLSQWHTKHVTLSSDPGPHAP